MQAFLNASRQRRQLMLEQAQARLGLTPLSIENVTREHVTTGAN